MVFFDRFFDVKKEHKLSINKLRKTSEMLDENKYWNIVDTSVKNAKKQELQEQYLIQEIKKLSPEEIIGFHLFTNKLLYDTYNSEMWCASFIMNGGCTEDGFEYFRNWIISRGKKIYYKAKNNPDNLIELVKGGDDFYEFEDFWYIALEAFKKKTGQELYDYIDYDDFLFHEGNYPKIELNWDDNNPETMAKICPKLFKKLW